MEVPRFSHQALLVDDGRILISSGFDGILGWPSYEMDIYDTGTGGWSRILLDDQGISRVEALKLPDGTVLFVGVRGYGTDEQVTGAAYGLNPTDLSWTQFADPPAAKAFHRMIQLKDGRVMVAGGIDLSDEAWGLSADPINTVDIYDPAANAWQQAAPMNTASQDLWLFLLNDGRVLAITGENEDSRDSRVYAQVYDPGSDTWTVVDGSDPAYLPTGAVQLSDGKVLVLGQLNEREATRAWRTVDGELIEVKLRDGRVYHGDRIREVFPDAKVYDPATDAWTATLGRLGRRVDASPSRSCSVVSCEGMTAISLTLLRDGRVLLAGGVDYGTEGFTEASFTLYSSTAIYDPQSNSWSPGPNLTERRAYHSATLMPDGWVFLLGGIGLRKLEDSEVPYSLRTLEAIDSMAMPPMDAVALTAPKSEEYSCEAIPIPEPSADLTPSGESLSPKDILGAANAAMNTLDSYHVELRSTVVSSTLEFGPDSPNASPIANCTRGAINFQAPDRVREHYSSYDHWGEVVHSTEYIFIGDAHYGTHPRTGEWKRAGSWMPEKPASPLGLIGDDAVADLHDASIDGMERLNDVEVYRISGTIPSIVFSKAISRNAYFTIHRPLEVVFWVGVDDSLVRKISAESGVEGAQFSRHYSIVVEYSAFDEEIVIEAPQVGAAP